MKPSDCDCVTLPRAGVRAGPSPAWVPAAESGTHEGLLFKPDFGEPFVPQERINQGATWKRKCPRALSSHTVVIAPSGADFKGA